MSSKLLFDLFRAYFDARKHKRKTNSAIKFEMNYEKEIIRLYKEIVSREYEISPSTCFISFYPVKREIFAGDFRDRVIHHLIFNYLNPFCEKIFINDSFSCRIGRGTSYGGKRAEHFMRSCSSNYKKDCFVLKLDISGYFMSIDKDILHRKIKKIIRQFEKEINFDRESVMWLIEKVLFNDPTKKCVVKGKRADWVGLAKSKSLFFAGKNKGLPIGNLTSQLFANLYLNDFDHLMKYSLDCKYYCRYVDDILIVHQDKRFLKSLFPIIDEYLKKRLGLSLHPKKIYLQHFSKGVLFLGRIILPYRNYLKNRTKGRIYERLNEWAMISKKKEISAQEKSKFFGCFHSYWGILGQANALKLRKRILAKLIGQYLKKIEP